MATEIDFAICHRGPLLREKRWQVMTGEQWLET